MKLQFAAGTIALDLIETGAIKVAVEIVPPVPFGEVCREALTSEAQVGIDRASSGAERVAGRLGDGLYAVKGSLAKDAGVLARVDAIRKWMQTRQLWMSGNERDAKRAEADAVKLETASSKAG